MEQLFRQTVEKTQTLECYGYRVIELLNTIRSTKKTRSFDKWWMQNLLICTLLDQEMHCLVAEPIRRDYTMKLIQGLKMKSSILMYAHSTHSFANMSCFHWDILPSCLRRTSTKTIFSNTVDWSNAKFYHQEVCTIPCYHTSQMASWCFHSVGAVQKIVILWRNVRTRMKKTELYYIPGWALNYLRR